MPIKTIAYACQYKCRRQVQKSSKLMAAHERRCAMNPQRRACKTCEHNRRDPEEGIWCAIEALPEGTKLMFDCPQWQASQKKP